MRMLASTAALIQTRDSASLQYRPNSHSEAHSHTFQVPCPGGSQFVLSPAAHSQAPRPSPPHHRRTARTMTAAGTDDAGCWRVSRQGGTRWRTSPPATSGNRWVGSAVGASCHPQRTRLSSPGPSIPCTGGWRGTATRQPASRPVVASRQHNNTTNPQQGWGRTVQVVEGGTAGELAD